MTIVLFTMNIFKKQPTFESAGFNENLSLFSPRSSNKDTVRSAVATASFKLFGDQHSPTTLNDGSSKEQFTDNLLPLFLNYVYLNLNKKWSQCSQNFKLYAYDIPVSTEQSVGILTACKQVT